MRLAGRVAQFTFTKARSLRRFKFGIGAALVSFLVFSERFGSLRIDLSFAAIAVKWKK